MNWAIGLPRLLVFAILVVFISAPLDSGESLLSHTRAHLDQAAARYRFEEAAGPLNQIIPSSDVFVTQLGEREALAAAALVAFLAALGGMGWIVAGFRERRF